MDFTQLSVRGTYTQDDLTADLFELAALFSSVDISTIGRSVEGRNLFAIRVGHGAKEVHYTAGLHANEWLTTPLLVKFCSDLCQAWDRKELYLGYDPAKIIENTSLWITPAMNPDGALLVQYGLAKDHPRYAELSKINGGSSNFRSWKSNINGVDLNHQFPARWAQQAAVSPKSPAPRNHAGASALSEPEAQALADFTLAHNFAHILALHSQGELIYWGYRGFEPPLAAEMVNTMARLSGYTAVRYAGTDAGYKDWFIQDWGRPGFTIEVGRGTNPLPPGALPGIYARLQKLLLWAATV